MIAQNTPHQRFQSECQKSLKINLHHVKARVGSHHVGNHRGRTGQLGAWRESPGSMCCCARLQTMSFAHYSGARGPRAIASTRWHGVASEPGATLSSRLGVANQQGFAGHFDCSPGLRRALLRSSPL